MKNVRLFLVGLLLAQLAFAAGFVGWLRVSGRLDRARLVKLVAMFKPTIQAERDAAEQAALVDAKKLQDAQDVARLEGVSKGPVSTVARLGNDQMADELFLQKLERQNREIRDLQDSLGKQNQVLSAERLQLDADRKAFADARKADEDLHNSEDFQRVVATLESLKAKQAKEILQDLVHQGKTTQVVEYLATMDLRKAAAILTEYKAAQEIAEATDLIQMLRKRGMVMDLDAPPAQMARKPDVNP